MLKSILSRLGNLIQAADPVCLLLMFPVGLATLAIFGLFLYDPEHYDKFVYHASGLFGVGFIWLLATIGLKGEADGE